VVVWPPSLRAVLVPRPWFGPKHGFAGSKSYRAKFGLTGCHWHIAWVVLRLVYLINHLESFLLAVYFWNHLYGQILDKSGPYVVAKVDILNLKRQLFHSVPDFCFMHMLWLYSFGRLEFLMHNFKCVSHCVIRPRRSPAAGQHIVIWRMDGILKRINVYFIVHGAPLHDTRWYDQFRRSEIVLLILFLRAFLDLSSLAFFCLRLVFVFWCSLILLDHLCGVNRENCLRDSLLGVSSAPLRSLFLKSRWISHDKNVLVTV
jgi:hypothetical protein